MGIFLHLGAHCGPGALLGTGESDTAWWVQENYMCLAEMLAIVALTVWVQNGLFL